MLCQCVALSVRANMHHMLQCRYQVIMCLKYDIVRVYVTLRMLGVFVSHVDAHVLPLCVAWRTGTNMESTCATTSPRPAGTDANRTRLPKLRRSDACVLKNQHDNVLVDSEITTHARTCFKTQLKQKMTCSVHASTKCVNNLHRADMFPGVGAAIGHYMYICVVDLGNVAYVES
jgi:hypothetical protein